MPTIAIAPCSKLPDYEEAVRRAGGNPLVLDRTADRPADVIAAAGGLLLAGGGDVLPALYGATTHGSFDPAEPGRDDYEIELARRALDADLPLFAICRGIQVLTVATGGTLIQDIPSEIGKSVLHMIREPRAALAHQVQITSGSLLDRLMQEKMSAEATLAVNSRHHQAALTIGEGLAVTAIAPDGVIEALEHPSRAFCLGVQWHPENFWPTGEFSALFEGFVAACKR
jgi:putative glutamine amidotransferase